MDFWQDLLFYQPDSIQGIVIIISMILNNQLNAKNRSIIMLGRRVPLIQCTGNSNKARPITIGDPLHIFWLNQSLNQLEQLAIDSS